MNQKINMKQDYEVNLKAKNRNSRIQLPLRSIWSSNVHMLCTFRNKVKQITILATNTCLSN